MNKETFYRAQDLDSEILLLNAKISSLKNAEMVRFSKRNKEDESGLVLTKEENKCSGTPADELKLYAKIHKQVLDFYNAKLKAAQSEFDKLK